jgi:hypothetical protein
MKFRVVLWHNLFIYCCSNNAINSTDWIMTHTHSTYTLYICCRHFNSYILIIYIFFLYIYRSYVTGKASGVCRLLLDGMEIMYLAVKNFIVMTVNTFQNDFSHIFNILYDIKVKGLLLYT